MESEDLRLAFGSWALIWRLLGLLESDTEAALAGKLHLLESGADLLQSRVRYGRLFNFKMRRS